MVLFSNTDCKKSKKRNIPALDFTLIQPWGYPRGPRDSEIGRPVPISAFLGGQIQFFTGIPCYLQSSRENSLISSTPRNSSTVPVLGWWALRITQKSSKSHFILKQKFRWKIDPSHNQSEFQSNPYRPPAARVGRTGYRILSYGPYTVLYLPDHYYLIMY